jgi:Phosphotransferase enzyme family/MobA-like NTP transferase domain
MLRQVIIQAGGRGSRLENLTTHKPKCLVPIDGKPLLQHTFTAFPGASFIVRTDYRGDVVERWLAAFPPDVPVQLMRTNDRGSAGGLSEAARHLPWPNEAVAVCWSDLMFDGPPIYMDDEALALTPHLAITVDFPCRWSVDIDSSDCALSDKPGRLGVPGLFCFPNAAALATVPQEGEFLEWFRSVHWPCTTFRPPNMREYGTLEALQAHWSDTPSRFFNDVRVHAETVSKRSRSPEYQPLLDDEAAWYRHVRREDFGNVPRVMYSDGVLTMGRVSGQHPWQMDPDTGTLDAIFRALQHLHRLGEAPASVDASLAMYAEKPMDRIAALPKLLPASLRERGVTVNGKRCGNMIGDHHFDRWATLAGILHPDRFALIHGDPTFSNTIVTPGGFPFFIDPRGRFGSVQFYGDPLYDYAKLWYSVVGGYDNFNRRQFTLEMGDGWADVRIKPSRWAGLSFMFSDRLGAEAVRRIRIIHGLIWLSLAGYVADYDEILAAYLMGVLTLEEALG